MQKPRGSASRADWMDYAIHKGYPREDVLDMTRNGIRDLVKSESEQDSDSRAPVADDTENTDAVDVATVEPELETAHDDEQENSDSSPVVQNSEPDYSQFLTPTDSADDAEASATAGQDAEQQTAQQDTPALTGSTVSVDGGSVRAVCVLGTYQVTDSDGTRHTVSRGEVLEGPERSVARGVELGLLQRL